MTADDRDGIDPATGWAYGWFPCGRDVCCKEDGHGGPCEPGGRPHPDDEQHGRTRRALDGDPTKWK